MESMERIVSDLMEKVRIVNHAGWDLFDFEHENDPSEHWKGAFPHRTIMVAAGLAWGQKRTLIMAKNAMQRHRERWFEHGPGTSDERTLELKKMYLEKLEEVRSALYAAIDELDLSIRASEDAIEAGRVRG